MFHKQHLPPPQSLTGLAEEQDNTYWDEKKRVNC